MTDEKRELPAHLADIMRACHAELTAALQEHAANYPDGDYMSANDRIEAVRIVADAAIIAAKRWPCGNRFLGNQMILKLLAEALTDD